MTRPTTQLECSEPVPLALLDALRMARGGLYSGACIHLHFATQWKISAKQTVVKTEYTSGEARTKNIRQLHPFPLRAWVQTLTGE